MGQLHCAVAVFQFRQMAVVRFRRLIDHGKHALCRCYSVLQFRNYAADLVERLRVLVGIGEKACQLSNGNDTDQRYVSGCSQCAADTYSSVNQCVDKSCHRVSDRAEKCRLCTCLLQLGVECIKAVFCTALIGKCLYHLL